LRRPKLNITNVSYRFSIITLIEKRCAHIDYRHRAATGRPPPSAPPSRRKPGDEVMFSPVMTWMDRALMQVVIVLAALPVVALVAGSLVS
jgi:hypothetical protein